MSVCGWGGTVLFGRLAAPLRPAGQVWAHPLTGVDPSPHRCGPAPHRCGPAPSQVQSPSSSPQSAHFIPISHTRLQRFPEGKSLAQGHTTCKKPAQSWSSLAPGLPFSRTTSPELPSRFLAWAVMSEGVKRGGLWDEGENQARPRSSSSPSSRQVQPRCALVARSLWGSLLSPPLLTRDTRALLHPAALRAPWAGQGAGAPSWHTQPRAPQPGSGPRRAGPRHTRLPNSCRTQKVIGGHWGTVCWAIGPHRSGTHPASTSPPADC